QFLPVPCSSATPLRKTQCLPMPSAAAPRNPKNSFLTNALLVCHAAPEKLNVYPCLQPPSLGIPRTQFLPMLAGPPLRVRKTQCFPMPPPAAPRNPKASVLTNACRSATAAPKNSMFTNAFNRRPSESQGLSSYQCLPVRHCGSEKLNV